MITGLRYTKENKDYTFSRLDPYDPAVSRAKRRSAPLNNTTGHYEGSHTDYRVGVEYQWTEKLMTYAQWSTGFRGGGVNPRPFIPQEVPFGTETVHASEIGLKTDCLDHHLRLNVAGFFNQYRTSLFVNTAPLIVNGVQLSANSHAGERRRRAHQGRGSRVQRGRSRPSRSTARSVT